MVHTKSVAVFGKLIQFANNPAILLVPIGFALKADYSPPII